MISDRSVAHACPGETFDRALTIKFARSPTRQSFVFCQQLPSTVTILHGCILSAFETPDMKNFPRALAPRSNKMRTRTLLLCPAVVSLFVTTLFAQMQTRT